MSPNSTPDIPDTEPAVLFRPSKKRKIYRQRATSPSQESPPPITSPIIPAPQSLDELISSTAQDVDTIAEVDMAEILRLRKIQRKAKGGVEFRAGNASATKENQELVVREEHVEGGLEEGRGVVRKFAAQTGAVGDVNKHMMAYIDSEIAKRRLGEMHISTPISASDHAGDAGAAPAGKAIAEVNRQPAALGKLHEIDLGDEARDKNVAMTNRATRRLNGECITEESAGSKKPAKVRLGRDGKPWRGKKRRGSDDIRRDQLVDEILRENKLEIYDSPSENEAPPDDDQAADDRIAEAFRKEFMDSVAARQRKQKVGPPAPTRTAGGKKEEVLAGPKLGGSRSARAAMRETMLKAAKK
ncbi:hypothetical protein HYFRA_00005851 [Hymenoscyphus fraxineus]|uniref:Uncharacterized protein n=1 Tax=Hymenoscyphus fraxineus TaxID=746836 RepID=A0A9N9PP44_9HELO|nr:hypothetical protein HYFRA_00005851 [Hymenoscyphus fraxineus]